MATKPLMTAEELFQIPDDDHKYELVKGELIRMSPTGGRHGIVTTNISTPLHSYIKSHHLQRISVADN